VIKKKVAIITGSTSGIGLAIARGLAREGASVVLNGFGDAKAIETLRADLAREFDVPVTYSGGFWCIGGRRIGLLRSSGARYDQADRA